MKARVLGAFLAVGVLTTALFGCPMKKKADDAPVDAGTISVTGTGAKNEAQITRYPNETALGGAPALIANNGTVARTFPGAGAQVAVLAKSTPCGKVAQYGNAGTLIMWNEPDGTTLMGWVPNGAFQASVNPSTIKPVTVPKDASAPAVQDAGGGTTPPPTPAAIDAGAPAADPCPVSCAPTNGQCPAGKKNDSGMCRIQCKKDADCPRNVKCQARGVCSSA